MLTMGVTIGLYKWVEMYDIKYKIFAVYRNHSKIWGRHESWRDYRVQEKEIPGSKILENFQEKLLNPADISDDKYY